MPLSGRVMKLEEVPDPVFSAMPSERGLAILPTEGRVLSPADGVVAELLASRHAVAIRTDSGVEVIVHVGLDTVAMRGEGFHPQVRKGDKVAAGQPLIEFSLELVELKATSTITPFFIANPGTAKRIPHRSPELAEAGRTPLMTVRVKP
ncbi:PTS glucose transporter subunit IIA [Paenibacillus sp. P26]|nr:PTS glucose transporter subunit IIA [Paenibacillus sp. P26]UUZ97716.1 PTS glucose transporter subunit IIA [Paenibacillus sp. P25]